ncbi:helix-turn-helix transcriptional regulator [[Clostridium] innocuum]|nr:helix-turn-helix transcriptional regulator [[Clostridium] innocuum]
MKESIDFKLIGLRIKNRREQLHITQQVMSDNLSISKYYISKIEHGKVKATLETLADIAHYLDMSISELISGTSPLQNEYCVSEYVEIYNKATPEQKNMILDIAKTITGNGK